MNVCQRAGSRVAGLELDEFGAGLVLPGGVFLALLVREDVDALEFVDGGGLEGGGVEEGAVAHDEDAELGAPVAEVVVAENGVAEGAVDALEGVADDGGADVGDVHRLGDVGGGVVEERVLPAPGWGTPRRASAWRASRWRARASSAKGQIDEAGAGDVGLGEQSGGVEPGDGFLGDGARGLAEDLGGGHGGVALVVAEGFVGGRNGVEGQRRQVGLREGGGERGAEAGGQDFFDRLHDSRNLSNYEIREIRERGSLTNRSCSSWG
jgi:hypothetical protein